MPALLIPPSVRPLPAIEYLLLGDLLFLLEESPGPTTGRWLLAVLDRVLTLRLQGDGDEAMPDRSGAGFPLVLPDFAAELIEKLQRLRDRVALRAPYQLLANEVRCELRMLFIELRRP
jgi:hypothetical protein